MNFHLIISTKARNQLWQVSKWYGERAQSDEIGMKWFEGFHQALDSLRTDPHRFGLARESHDLRSELRELLYGSGRRKTHRAIFRIVGDRVEVIAIRHLAQRDLEATDIL